MIHAVLEKLRDFSHNYEDAFKDHDNKIFPIIGCLYLEMNGLIDRKNYDDQIIKHYLKDKFRLNENQYDLYLSIYKGLLSHEELLYMKIIYSIEVEEGAGLNPAYFYYDGVYFGDCNVLYDESFPLLEFLLQDELESNFNLSESEIRNIDGINDLSLGYQDQLEHDNEERANIPRTYPNYSRFDYDEDNSFYDPMDHPYVACVKIIYIKRKSFMDKIFRRFLK